MALLAGRSHAGAFTPGWNYFLLARLFLKVFFCSFRASPRANGGASWSPLGEIDKAINYIGKKGFVRQIKDQ